MANKWQTLSSVTGSPWGNASDGDITISSNTTQAETSRSCTGSGTSLTIGSSGFSDGDVVVVLQVHGTDSGQWEYAKIASGGGTTSITVQKSLQYTYGSGAVIQKLPQYGTVVVESGKTWSATAWNGTANGIFGFIARDVTITGSISASGKGFRGGASSGDTGSQGESELGTGSTLHAANGMAGGGGGKNQAGGRGSGAGGGYATSGGNGSASTDGTAIGGGTNGIANLTVMLFGGAGGGAGGSGNTTDGGRSGGIVFITARNTTITGSIISW